MSTVIDRDWKQQENFGKDLIAFENNMRNCTRRLRSSVEEARGAALDSIIELLDQIDGSLPGVAEFGSIQIKLAHHIRDAEDFKFKSR